MNEQKDEQKDHVHIESAWTGNVIFIVVMVAIIVAALVYREYFA